MSSPDIASLPQTEDVEANLDGGMVALYKKAMQGKWLDVADAYAQNKEVRKTPITWAGDTFLHLAASSGVEKNVMLLMDCLRKIENEEEIHHILEIQNERGDTALHIAAALGMERVCLAMASLHPKMVDSNPNWRKETPLFEAVRHGHKKAFFALQSFVNEKLLYRGVRREGGDTILHDAISAEHFDLALEIIHLYPEMVHDVNEKGESPLHLLADKPSAFKSGTHFNLLDRLLYRCISVNDYKVKYQKYKEKFSKNEAPSTSNEDDKSKHSMDVEIEISTPQTSDEDKSKHSTDVEIEILAPWTGGDDDKSEHITDAEVEILENRVKAHQRYPKIYYTCFKFIKLAVKSLLISTRDENGVKAYQNGLQNHPRYPKHYYTCFEFLKLAVKFLLVITGAGSFLKNIGAAIAGIIKKKQKNAYAYQIMDKLVCARKELFYGRAGMFSYYGRENEFVRHPEVEYENEFVRHPDIKDETKENNPQQIQEQLLKIIAYCCCKQVEDDSKQIANYFCKQVEDDSKQQPIEVAPILVATKRGVIEMVKKILEDIPEATLDRDHDDKNIVLLAVEHGHLDIYNYLLQSEVTQSLFVEVDRQGNSALHLAAGFIHKQLWIRGAAFKMQFEAKWYKYVEKSKEPGLFAPYNNNRETAQDIFTKSHKDLIKEAREWFINTSGSSSVVAALVATVAYTSATSVPGGNNQNTGDPIFEGQPAFQVFAISSLVAFCFSVTALVFFLSIVTSRFHELDFAHELPTKLFGGMTTLFVSIAANLVSFCAGHFYITHHKLGSGLYYLYAGLILPVMAFFFTSQWRLYADLVKARFYEQPERHK